MNFDKLILASCTLGPLGFAFGYGPAWLFRAETPSLFGAAVGALFVLLAMTGGSSAPADAGEKGAFDPSLETSVEAQPMMGENGYVPHDD